MKRENRLKKRVQNLVTDYRRLWDTFDCFYFPDLGYKYSTNEKFKREKELQDFLDKNSRSGKQNNSLNQVRPAFEALCKSALDLDGSKLDDDFLQKITEVARRFVKQARVFDPHLSNQELYQACRNVWSMNCLQFISETPIDLTLAIFSYSLLYPYTDNFLDDSTISIGIKNQFNERFGKRLSGQIIQPQNQLEMKVFQLVEKIEKQFPRINYPEVYESLLAIHRAQIKSLRLLQAGKKFNGVDVLGISIEKGGASVLADGYLVSGKLSKQQEDFMFGFGTYLQLVDDIQDVQTDLESGLLTIFSGSIQDEKLDNLTNCVFQFGFEIMEKIGCFNNKNVDFLKSYLGKIFNLLIIKAVGSTQKYYSKTYLKNLEGYSPYRFSFLRNHVKNKSVQNRPAGAFKWKPAVLNTL